MAQQPAGVQIYLATSMVFSLTQSLAMRTDSIRHSIGLPSLHAKPKGMHEGLYVQEFMQQMQERQEAKERGEFVLGEGVLKMGAPMATLGEKRKSSIVVDNMDGSVMEFNEMISSKSSSSSSLSSLQGNDSMKMIEIASIIHTPPSLLVDPERFNNNNKNLSMRPTPLLPPEMPPTFDAATATMIPSSTTNISSPTSLFNNDNKNNNTMPQISISAMEAANRGERPVELAPKEIIQQREEQKKRMSEAPIDVTKLKSKWSRQKGSSAGGRQQQGRKPSLGGGGGGRGGKKSGGRWFKPE